MNGKHEDPISVTCAIQDLDALSLTDLMTSRKYAKLLSIAQQINVLSLTIVCQDCDLQPEH